VTISASAGPAKVSGNLAASNGCFGFYVQGGRSHVLKGNIAVGNLGEGFFLSNASDLAVEGNESVSNGSYGFVVFGERYSLVGNTAIGNTFAGIGITGGSGHTIQKNNIFGNNVRASTGVQNCGLLHGVAGSSLDATRNFWGAPGGPGADPADAVCDFGGAMTISTPFASKEFGIKSPIR